MTGLAHTLNGPADNLMRTALRNAIKHMLSDEDFPTAEAQAAYKWLEKTGRPVDVLADMKDRTLEILQEARSAKEVKAQHAARQLAQAA